jgi:hypothetical protein
VASFLRLVLTLHRKEYLDVNSRALAALLLLVMLVAFNVSCVRQSDFAAAGQPSSQERALPFHSEAPPDATESNFPLAGLMVGTPIAVHVETPLSSAHSRPGSSFTAVLAEPLVASGHVVAPKGTVIKGKILEAKPSEPADEAGYLRLTLAAISLGGKTWPLQTSHVFLKGATYERESVVPVQLASASTAVRVPSSRMIQVHEDVGIASDRKLIFRLSQAISVQIANK